MHLVLLATPIGEPPRAPQHTIVLPWPPRASENDVMQRTSPALTRSRRLASRRACQASSDTARDIPPFHGLTGDNNPHSRLGAAI